MNTERLYSYHTFMLPFIFEGDFIELANWHHKLFEIKQQRDFNEYNYFYKHVREALLSTNDENAISKYYEYDYSEGSYKIESKKGTFILDLDGLSLRLFNTNVAILVFHCKNRRYENPEEILAINDFGRRIYPAFLGENFTQETKESSLAYSLSLTIDKHKYKEDFKKFDTIESLQKKNFSYMPLFVQALLKDNFRNFENIEPVIDDRMFVLSLYNYNTLSQELQRVTHEKQYAYECHEWWYKYIFIDGESRTCQSKYMLERFIKEATYDRWVEWGTLFGISRYSFVALSETSFGENVLLAHMQTMYFQIFSLLLCYRATIIKFSDDIQNITSQPENLIAKETQLLYKRYLDFLNKLYFKELTAQDQGIELYNQAFKVMELDKYMNDLDNEINELHSYVTMIEEKNRNEQLDFISKLGGILLPPSLLAGFFGVNTVHTWGFFQSSNGVVSVVLLFTSFFIMPVWMMARNFMKKGLKK